MSRPPPRSRRTNVNVSPVTHGAGNGSSTASEPLEAGWQRTLDLSRTVFGASLGTSQEWMRGLVEFQVAQAAALRRAGEAIDEIASQAERAPDWPSLWTLQANLAGTQWTRAIQDCSDLIGQAMQIEARLVERTRADASRLSQSLLGEINGQSGDRVVDASDVAEVLSPVAMLAQAQASMTEMSRLWTQAIYKTAVPD